MKVLPDYCQAEAQESPEGGQERGEEYIKTCHKKGFGRNAVVPHTLPGMLELPLQQSFKENSGLHFPPNSKKPRATPKAEAVSWSLSPWGPSHDFQPDFTAEVSTRTHQFPTQQSDRPSSFPVTCHFRPSCHSTRGADPQTQTPGRACGQDLARCHQSWSQPPLEAAALAAGRSTANTNIMLCSHGNQSVMFITLSFLGEKKTEV